jgi:hypothetical protein
MYNRTFKDMGQAYMATTCVLSDAAWGNLKTSSDQEEPGTWKQMSRMSLGKDKLPAKTSNVDPTLLGHIIFTDPFGRTSASTS